MVAPATSADEKKNTCYLPRPSSILSRNEKNCQSMCSYLLPKKIGSSIYPPKGRQNAKIRSFFARTQRDLSIFEKNQTKFVKTSPAAQFFYLLPNFLGSRYLLPPATYLKMCQKLSEMKKKKPSTCSGT